MIVHPDRITIDGDTALWTVPGPVVRSQYALAGIPSLIAELIRPCDGESDCVGGRRPFVLTVDNVSYKAAVTAGPILIDGQYVTELTFV